MPKGGQRALPSGVVTFVFTDIEGSTQLLRTLEDRYPDLLEQHHGALRSAWRRHRGAEVNTDGDAFFVAFESADDALAAAVTGQQALARVRWIGEETVLVRMGMHTGFARPHGDDYAALAVHQAARVIDAAHGGQILMSSDTRRALRRKPKGVQIESLGRFRVRDFAAPEELFQVRSTTLPVRHWVPRAVPADGHNLVAPPTPVLGRDRDLEVLDELVRPGGVVTVIGPGGIGKTRVAIEHGLRRAGTWADGIWFVDLSSTTSGGHLYAAVAEAIGAKAVPGQETRLDVLDDLARRRLLLVLDNCEHVAPAAAEMVRDLSSHCPGVGILATSRSPLGLRDERIHRLGPLGTVEDAPAVRLFLERSGLPPHDAPLEEVRSLCEAVDGLPLAIEIAATRAAVLGTGVVLERLQGSLSVIRSKDPTLPERQRTLRAVLDWSFDLLDPPVRALLGKLSVLPAGFDVDTVVSAWADDDEVETLEMLFTLVEHSLLARADTQGPTRFRVPVTVRAHALDETTPSARAAAARAVGRTLLARLGPEQSTDWPWVSEMALELDNLRAVIDLVAGRDDELGQTLAWSIGHYHDRVHAFATAAAEIADRLEALPSPTPARVALLCLLAETNVHLRRPHLAADLLAQAEALREQVGGPVWDDQCVAKSRADLALDAGDPALAADTCRRALDLATSPRSRCRLLSTLGIAEGIAGATQAAVDAFREELRIETEAGMRLYLHRTHGNLAESLLRAGDTAGAAAHQLQALDSARAHDDQVQTALSMLLAAQLCVDHGWPAEAVTLHAAGMRALESTLFVLYAEDQRRYEQSLGDARASLDDTAFELAHREGRALDADAAADRATRILEDLSGQGRSDRSGTAEGIRST